MPSLLQGLLLQTAALFSIHPPQADILFAGDAMQHQGQLDAASRGRGVYDYSECFSEVKDYVTRADYAVVNLETPVAGAPYSGYPCFNAPAEYAAELQRAGFDLFLTANNHTLDRRDRGLLATVAQLDSLGVDHIGTYRDADARRRAIPMVKRIKGFDVGFLNYTYGTNGITPGHTVRVDYIDTTLIASDIAVTRRRGAEVIVVNVHWGDEYHLQPNASQRRLARWLHDQGVEVVMGGHPHVVQPMEFNINPTDTFDRRLTVYSLGNFISNMKTRDTRGGAMVKVTLRRSPTGHAYVAAACYAPVFTLPPSGRRNFKLIRALDHAPGYDAQRREFLGSAKTLFDKYNINVPIDSIF